MEYKVVIGGKKGKVRFIDIENVPYKVIKIYQDIGKKIVKIQDIANRLLQIDNDIAKNPDNKKALIDERNDIAEQIYAVQDSGFFDERFEAIKLVLSMNGIKDNDELMDKRTWDEKMDYADPMAFIEFCVNKDIKKNSALIQDILKKKD